MSASGPGQTVHEGRPVLPIPLTMGTHAYIHTTPYACTPIYMHTTSLHMLTIPSACTQPPYTHTPIRTHTHMHPLHPQNICTQTHAHTPICTHTPMHTHNSICIATHPITLSGPSVPTESLKVKVAPCVLQHVGNYCHSMTSFFLIFVPWTR